MARRKSPNAETATGTRVSSRIKKQTARAAAAANASNTSTTTSNVPKPSTKRAKTATTKSRNANNGNKATTKAKPSIIKPSTTKASTKKTSTAVNGTKKNKNVVDEGQESDEQESAKTAKGARAKVNGVKRKRSDDEDEMSSEDEKPAKKARGSTTKTKKNIAKKVKKPVLSKKASIAEKKKGGEEEPIVKTRPAADKKPGPTINFAPTQKINVFVFGENSSGELGIGHLNLPGKRAIDVKRPRLNPKLSVEEVGVVMIACGGMHNVALTHDNKILTWGVNDQGALGRSTKGAQKLKTIDENGEEVTDEDDDPNDTGLNPLESTPGEVDYINIPEGTTFTKVAAGDSVTMVLTSTGLVYGCGTFRSNEGILGFTKDIKEQHTLAQIPGLKNIVKIACGADHVLALDNKGHLHAFGSGQQDQLGRRIIERTKLNALFPSPVNIPRRTVVSVFAGAYHSFAIDDKGDVWSWGLNSYGQTGLPEEAGSDGGSITVPTRVPNLSKNGIMDISGGTQHSVAVNEQGQVLVWGRTDGEQMGQDTDDIPEANFIRDDEDKVDKRLVLVPTRIPTIKNAIQACASGGTSIAVTADGKAYSWGFSTNYQTGQGTTEDVEEATLIENSAIKDEKLSWCGLGGQYGVLASAAKEAAVEKNGDGN